MVEEVVEEVMVLGGWVVGWEGLGRRRVQVKDLYFEEDEKTPIAPKHFLPTFQRGLGLYIHLCQQISPSKPSIVPLSHSLT